MWNRYQSTTKGLLHRHVNEVAALRTRYCLLKVKARGNWKLLKAILTYQVSVNARKSASQPQLKCIGHPILLSAGTESVNYTPAAPRMYFVS